LKCEFINCKAKAIQADTYLNSWLCDNHYSLIGIITDDYQAEVINWDYLESLTN